MTNTSIRLGDYIFHLQECQIINSINLTIFLSLRQDFIDFKSLLTISCKIKSFNYHTRHTMCPDIRGGSYLENASDTSNPNVFVAVDFVHMSFS